jgi:hypothetical protein
MLHAVLNIPQPPTSFNIYNKTVRSAVADVNVSFMMQASREAVVENEEDDLSHIIACFAGAWQNWWHTSLSDIMSATSVNRGKVFNSVQFSSMVFINVQA